MVVGGSTSGLGAERVKRQPLKTHVSVPRAALVFSPEYL